MYRTIWGQLALAFPFERTKKHRLSAGSYARVATTNDIRAYSVREARGGVHCNDGQRHSS